MTNSIEMVPAFSARYGAWRA